MKPRILVVGGAGAFGRRLVDGLLATTDVIVVVAARTLRHDGSFIESLEQRYGEDRIEAVRLDRDSAFDVLCHMRPFCVVDAAGPFQGGKPSLARAAIATGCHYVDLADARDFVMDFSTLNATAQEAGVLAVTGASSTPALSGAALEALVDRWRRVDEIAIAISPGNRAPRGRSVVAAILAYAGRPVRVWMDGDWTTRPGWGELVRRDMPNLGRRWLSLCETPDLDLMPARYPTVRTVMFRAGLELSILHLGLWLLTWPVRLGLIRSLQPFAAGLRNVAGWVERFGTDRGGMSVEVAGTDRNGHPTLAIWSLSAQAGDGPNIPVLPALPLIRGLLLNSVTVTGARIAGDLLSLASIESEFRRFRIAVHRGARWPQARSLFEKTLGPEIEVLPALMRRIHTEAPAHLKGRVAIEGAPHPIAKLIARDGVAGEHGGRERRGYPAARWGERNLDPSIRAGDVLHCASCRITASTVRRTVWPHRFRA